MKTLSKTFQQAANIAIVQFETLTDDGFHFLPAGPAIHKGDLVLRELDEVEDVNTLLAINKTDNFYLLTDMDLLKGARQNRVVNISVLVGFDLFGNRLCYAHYFDMLEKDALDRVRNEGALPVVDQAEAFLLLEEFLGRFESSLEEDDARETAGNGKHKWSGSDSTPGFALEYEKQVVHMVGFSK